MRISVVGYSSMDNSMSMSTFQGIGYTTLVRRLSEAAEPGGIARFFQGLSHLASSALSWVGRDEMSNTWIGALSECGVDTSHVAQLPGRMPTSFLMHGADGETLTFFDPGITGAPSYSLSDGAKAVIAESDLLLLAVSPTDATLDALSCVGASTSVIWVVKADPNAYPIGLRERLIERANLIISSHHEESFLSEAGQSFRGSVVQTAGAEPVRWKTDSDEGMCPVKSIPGLSNSTGAGDVFAGHLIGRWSEGDSLPTAVKAGIEASGAYLFQRTKQIEGS